MLLRSHPTGLIGADQAPAKGVRACLFLYRTFVRLSGLLWMLECSWSIVSCWLSDSVTYTLLCKAYLTSDSNSISGT